MDTFGRWAAKQGVKQCLHHGDRLRSRPATSEAAFTNAFEESGGQIVGSVRFPVANPDFSAFIQRAKDLNPECIYIFVPGGAPDLPRSERRSRIAASIPTRRRFWRRAKSRPNRRLPTWVTPASASFRRGTTTTRASRRAIVEFVRLHNELHKRNPDQFSLGGYDGMHLIYEALKKTGGKTDGDSLIAAAKGMSWESPRG